MRVLGVNGVFHDPAAALVVNGMTVAAAEEERFSRRKHGKPPVAFSTWELPEQAMKWCLEEGGVRPKELDAVAYSYDPALGIPLGDDVTSDQWEGLRTLYVERAPLFLKTALPGLDPGCVRFVAHHVAHAASAHLAAGWDDCAVLVLDGRGARAAPRARPGGRRLRRARARRARRARVAPRRPCARPAARVARGPAPAGLARPAVRGAHRPRLVAGAPR